MALSRKAFLALQAYRLLHGFAAMTGAAAAPVLSHYSRRVKNGFKDFFGQVQTATGPVLWVHGVSMGESMVAAGFVTELRKKFPAYQIAFTTTHPDVYANICKRGIADLTAFFPLDNLVAMQRVFDRWQPKAVFVAETDFWPEFSWQCRSRNIPLILINGRISEKIARFYQQFPAFAELVFPAFSLLAVQTSADAERLLNLGVTADRVKVLGNMKADLTPAAAASLEPFRNWLGPRRCLVLGSLHPSEFAVLQPSLSHFAESGVAVIIAPRNPANCDPWLKELQGVGLATGLRSGIDAGAASDILLLDSMGELAALYRLADVAFVGGSIDAAVGGHNPLEVMQQHVPLLMGPNCRNFADIVEQLKTADGIEIVADATQLQNAVKNLLADQKL
ncbi:MAG TPA: glycosyltransferase N-terminal domain-containing protein, partial [Candidatus Rifleibacterium sp.]|nr:glycosyltransferase N-terminal domain-containing protein [Candidatus Rifleibacterium sp.]